MTPPRLFLDNECYVDYFLAMFMVDDGRSVAFEKYDGHPLDIEGIERVLASGAEVITFNGIHYDKPLLLYAMAGATNAELKAASDDIICNNVKSWQFEKKYPQYQVNVNLVDLIEVAPGIASLKIYGGRMHSKKMQDLPIEPSASIRPHQRPLLRKYCKNDLRVTRDLANKLAPQLEVRRILSKQLADELDASDLGYLFDTQDLRSRSDAQIAEAVLKQRVFMRTGAIPRKRPAVYPSFRYTAPSYIKFRDESLQHALQVLTTEDMVIADTGHVRMPAAVEKLSLTLGETAYKLGLGGIHSQESEVSHYASDAVYLRDIDVVSYYPNMMLNMGMYPDSMGPHFLAVFRDILVERVAAKRAGEKAKNESYKIVLNGTFGKTASKYSIFYNPQMMVATTITGQLSLLMLIEALTRYGIPVVSANTDGVVVKCPRELEDRQRLIVKTWEKVTKLETEETDYRSIHSRDVNSYIAIKTDGKVKSKGAFAYSGLAKNPSNEICLDAVIAYLTLGTPVEQTVRGCADLSKFVTVRRVTGGAVKDGDVIGKAIRWYYSSATRGTINYASNDNTVPRSVGAKPVMDLPDQFPTDVDYDWYITEANELLMDIAVLPRPPKAKLPRRNTKEWKALAEIGMVEVDDYGAPRWAVHFDQIPDAYKPASLQLACD